jgi:hypothetical protein
MTPRRVRRSTRPGLRVRGRTGVRAREGFALLTVLMVSVVGTVLALAAAVMAMSNVIVQNSSDRAAMVDDVALSGLEEARARLNAGLDSVPVDGYGVLEADALIPNSGGVRRSVWVSRLGNSDSLSNAGEFGVQAELVSRAIDPSGSVAVRRSQMYQESFARYASFTDIGKNTANQRLWWALGAQAQGPVHSNDTIYVWSGMPRPQAIFHSTVTTAQIVLNKTAAEYRGGAPQERVARIEMPGSADLDVLKGIAARAGYVFTPNTVLGDSALATMRIEFLAIDADGDGNTTGPDDGYFRVYQYRAGAPAPPEYVLANTPPPPTGQNDSLLFSRNCGVVQIVGGRQAVPVTFWDIPISTGSNYRNRMRNKQDAWDSPQARCFLGGDERLSPDGIFRASDDGGDWMLRTSGTVPATVAARPDGAYLWPLSPSYNPNFRGVIFAEGKVAVSGTVRGRITVASRNIMMIAHGLQQATSPAVTSGTCRPDDDIVGLFSGENILYSDNSLLSPQQRRDNSSNGSNWLLPRKDFDPAPSRPDLPVHASLLALRSTGAERPSPPAGLAGSRWVTRGTIRLIGGSIESRIGMTGTMNGSGQLHGYFDDLSFNRCALPYPPPYFPTTGHWTLSQYYEVDPVGFDPATWFVGR